MKRRVISSRGRLWRLITAGLCLMLSVGFFWAGSRTGRSCADQWAAETWQAGDLRYSQVSAFLAQGMTWENIRTLESKLDTALAAESLAAQKNARLWVDAYSTKTALTVKSDHGSATVRAIATGGDYFLFHPLDMVSGWYYTADDLMQDAVLLDRSLAWTLFGSTDLTDMTVTIAGKTCRVAGVVETPSGLEGSAYGTEPTLWLPWSLLEQLSDTAPAADCYEALLPDPVSGFALGKLQDALGLSDADCETVENTGRFGLWRGLKGLGSLGSQVRHSTAIAYPYWENAARSAQLRVAFLDAGALVCLLWPVGLCLYAVIHLARKGRQQLTLWIKEKKQ